jgi:ribosomal protein S18 acetylase RimI-like enzyme
LALDKLRLVGNNPQYFEFIRILRNDSSIKAGFIEQDEISPEQHDLYMKRFFDCYQICLLDNVPVGYVGVVEDDLRVAVSKDFQNLGVGKFMVTEILKLYPNAKVKVKYSNLPSQRLFEGLGFTKELIYYKSPLSD